MANKITNLDNLTKLANALNSQIKDKVAIEEARAAASELDLQQNVDEIRNMLGGKSLVYLTQAEYDNLTDIEKNDENIIYCITDAENMNHEHLNKEFLDSLNQEVLDAKQDKEDQNLLTENKTIELDIKKLNKEEFDAALGNLNFEDMGNDIFDLQAKVIELETYKVDKEYVDNKLSTTVQNISPVNNVLTLTTNKYQKTVIANETEIVFPQVTELTELHLYFDKNDSDEMNLILPDNCKWRVDPNIEDASAYELIAVYNTSYWLVNIVSYSDDNTLSL